VDSLGDIPAGRLTGSTARQRARSDRPALGQRLQPPDEAFEHLHDALYDVEVVKTRYEKAMG
jgi:hypothetical protein